MANVIRVDIVDSEQQIFSGDAEYVVVPGSAGEIGIYPHHIPLISQLKIGVLRLQLPEHGTQLIFAISGGFVEVQDNHVTILSDIVERTEELDEARLIEQKTAALARVKHANATVTDDVAKAQASLEMAIAQLKALDFLKKQSNRV